MQCAAMVVQSEQQRADECVLAVLVPSKAGHDTVGRARVLHLDHGALARLVASVFGFGDHTVEAGPLETRQPLRRRPCVARHGRQVDRRTQRAECALQQAAPLRLRDVPHVPSVDARADRRRQMTPASRVRALRCATPLDGGEAAARRSRAPWRRDHDLAVDDDAGRDLGRGRPRALGEVADRAASDRGSGCRRHRGRER